MDSKDEVRVEAPQRRGGILSRLRPGDQAPPTAFERLLKTVRSYNQKADVRELQKAFAFAEAAHEGQVRKSGEPFVSHPLAVASILADLHL
ncbi:MAG: bifunctional (p)ppGpp synthetase/guanosine-3',5'-bis(diphosphate) 3'-pyrophosphohydrolase, partial [Actinobacteria bacterium]|nr:bifunctional (p)ppGpp synthetase/guanosine-3',5'-bis(diphosphate) 3'-pyrophosphohydrolase [Actinomycetota bacterium]